MTIIDLLEDYSNGTRTAIQVIRDMTGIFNPEHAASILPFVCAITRVEQDDLDMETFRTVYLKLPKRPEGNLEKHPDGVKEI